MAIEPLFTFTPVASAVAAAAASGVAELLE
jgi:hypothetical protein